MIKNNKTHLSFLLKNFKTCQFVLIRNWKLKIRNSCQRQAGFTMVEMIIYMGLLAAFLSVITSIFVASLDVQLESRSLSSVEQDSRFILSRLIYDVHSADSISSPTLGQNNSTLIFTKNGLTYTYSLSGNNILLDDGSGAQQLNSFDTNITALSFTRIGNVVSNNKDTIKVDLTLVAKTRKNSGFETKNISTTIGTR